MLTDVRYALRSFLRTPGFTAVAVITLALGIGATTAIFSVVNAVLLRPLPYPHADRLVVARLSIPDYEDVRAASQSFDATGLWASNLYNLRTGSESQQVLGGVLSPELMPMLGVEPLLGRTFNDSDGAADVVVLGHALWQSRFGGDPGVLGRSVDLSGASYTVIGVAPAWFRFPSAEFQLWTSIGTMKTKAVAQMKNRSLRIFNMVARLRPGVTLEQSAAELAAISGTLSNTYPATNENIVITPQSLYERTVGNVRPALLMILVTVALLLLIACANVANLLLARTTAREREMAVRAALGAGRARLMRQLATESVVLASLGGLLGLLITMWGVDVLPAILEARLPRAETIAIDAPVLIFTLMATLVTALFFGTAPALQMLASRTGALKDHARGVAGSSRGRRVRQVIIVAEVALAVTVIIGAGLLVRSFNVLLAQTPGFDPNGVVSFNVQLVSKPDGPARAQAASALMEHLASVPGVRSVGASTGFPTVTPQRGTRFELDGRQLTPDQSGAYLIAATPGYFDALRTPVLRGRSIAAADRANAEPVVLINQTLASALFGGDDPVGRRLRIINPEHSNAWRTIVGVVGDVRYQGLDREVQPTIYTSFAQTPMMWLYVMARTDGNPSALAQTIRSAVSAFDPSLTAANVRPMPEVIAGTVDEPRFQMTLVSGFALLALVLAAIGIYGVIAYSVTQRTHELGVRVALGASGRDVMKMVLGEGLLVTTIGVAAGLLASFMLTRLMASMLFGVTARDPIAFSAGASVLLAVALLASWIPARRATRVDPVVALRAE